MHIISTGDPSLYRISCSSGSLFLRLLALKLMHLINLNSVLIDTISSKTLQASTIGATYDPFISERSIFGVIQFRHAAAYGTEAILSV